MKTPPIQEQIEALTQELRPFPKEGNRAYWIFNGIIVSEHVYPGVGLLVGCHYWSYNKAEVEEYADCYHRLKLYQLLGKKAEKVFPLVWNADPFNRVWNYGTDFSVDDSEGQMKLHFRCCVFGGVWFAREEDRLEALKICGIDAEFQKKCTKFGLGGA